MKHLAQSSCAACTTGTKATCIPPAYQIFNPLCFYVQIADPTREIAVKYGMIDPELKDKEGLPLTCRSVSRIQGLRVGDVGVRWGSRCVVFQGGPSTVGVAS